MSIDASNFCYLYIRKRWSFFLFLPGLVFVAFEQARDIKHRNLVHDIFFTFFLNHFSQGVPRGYMGA